MSLIKTDTGCDGEEVGKDNGTCCRLYHFLRKHKVRPAVLLAYLAVVAVFVFVFASFYIPGKRFSYVVMFGDKQPPVLSVLDNVDFYSHRDSWGYDGQFYAQIAMEPMLRNPELRDSIDSLSYRGRRVLMGWSAYLMGWGIPEAVLHTYTLQNPIAWLGLAVLMLWWFPPNGWGNWFRWTGVLLCSGMWASVINALTDGPSLLIVAFGVFLIERNKPWLAAAVFGISGLAKETNILGGSGVIDTKKLFVPREWPKLVLSGLVIVAPLIVWILYMRAAVGLASSSGENNFSWPFYWWAWKLKVNVIDAFSQSFLSGRGIPNFSFLCLLGFVALTVQLAFFVFRPKWRNAWWRVGISFSFLMAMLGQAVWEGYSGAAFRVLLPMQLAFNVLVPRTRRWIIVLILGNLSLFTEVHVVLDRMKEVRRHVQVVSSQKEYGKVQREMLNKSVTFTFLQGWYGVEESRAAQWLWSSGESEITLRNRSESPQVVTIAFSIYSLVERDFTLIGPDGTALWQSESLKEKLRVTVDEVLLKPGENVLKFKTQAAASFAPHDSRPLAFCVENFSASSVRVKKE